MRGSFMIWACLALAACGGGAGGGATVAIQRRDAMKRTLTMFLASLFISCTSTAAHAQGARVSREVMLLLTQSRYPYGDSRESARP